MEKTFENKMAMLQAVLSFMRLKADDWSDSAPMAAAFAELEDLILQIEQIQQITEEDNSGLTEANKLQKKALIKRIFELVSILYAMAVKTDDQVLQAKVDFPISELQNGRNSELTNSGKSILELGRTNLPALIEYGLSEEKLNNLDEQIMQFKVSLPAPRVSVSERKAANAKLKELLKQTMKLISQQIDRLMIPYETSKPDFYAAYKNARKLVNYGIRHEKAETTEPSSPD